MLKLLVILSLFIVAVVAQCDLQEPICVSIGGDCSADIAECSGDAYCSVGGKCVVYQPIGGACTRSEQCLNYNSGDGMCLHETCQAITFTMSLGQACTNLQQCSTDYWCNNTNFEAGVCLSFQQEGQSCVKDDDNCASALECNEGVCIQPFSVPAGGICDDDPSDDFSVTCQAGLYCSGQGICTKPGTPSHAPCLMLLPICPGDEQCTCTGGPNAECIAPTVLTSDQATKMTSLVNCLVQSHDCDITTDRNCCPKESCVLWDLELHYWNTTARKAIFKCSSVNPLDQCPQLAGGGGMSLGEKIGIIAGAIAGVLIVAGIIVYFYKSRHNSYHKI